MYKTKVSGACKQDEDLLGEKFRYNKEDDIVLLFNEGKMDTAYCYKREDLGRLVKNGYKQDNTRFAYIVSPHTNQYIVNPEEILNSRWHSFVLKPVRDRREYRRDYPETLYYVERGDDPIFEEAPELGDEAVEEKIEIKPSEGYLETERKMRELRERRGEVKEDEDEEEEEEDEEEYEREPVSIRISDDPTDIEVFENYKAIYDQHASIFPRQKEMWLRKPGLLDNILYTDEDGKQPEIIETDNPNYTRPGIDPNLVWINKVTGYGYARTDIIWHKGNEIHRANKPAVIKIWEYDNGARTRVVLMWYVEGRPYNYEKPSFFDTEGKLIWHLHEDHIPSEIDFVKREILFETSNLESVLASFNNEIFEDVETRGKLVFYNDAGIITDIIYIRA